MCLGELRGRDHTIDVYIDRRMVLKWMLEILVMIVSSELARCRVQRCAFRLFNEEGPRAALRCLWNPLCCGL
jgi:hypothetical protein